MPRVARTGAKKKQNGYKMPDPITKGEILTDISSKKWKLGSSIGKGGFGEIYSAQENGNTSTKNSTFPYVIKIEPHSNGPLFVEMHFFMRNAKKADIDTFINSKKISSLGMPAYCGSGSHEYKNVKYRFIVMERFGSDIWKIFLENKRIFNPSAVYKIAIQILDVLEYIHSKGYIHADIKGANILLDLKNKNQVYLVDFGLAVHYFTGDKFKPDPKKAHDGTIEYLSRDAHLGVPTRRGDLEILIYNVIQWLGCTLPWEKDIKDPMVVKASKEKHMDDIPLFMKTCFGKKTAPEAVVEVLKYHKTLDFNTDIDYKKVRKIFEKALQAVGGSLTGPLVFKVSASPAKRKTNSETPLSGKKMKISRRKLLDNCTGDSDEKETADVATDEELESELATNKEKIKNETPKRRGRKPKVKKVERELEMNDEDVDDEENKVGYTAEMKRIVEKMEASKVKKTTKRGRVKKQNSEEKRAASPDASSSTTPVRSRRNRKVINYKQSGESRNNSSDDDEDVAGNSEDD